MSSASVASKTKPACQPAQPIYPGRYQLLRSVKQEVCLCVLKEWPARTAAFLKTSRSSPCHALRRYNHICSLPGLDMDLHPHAC